MNTAIKKLLRFIELPECTHYMGLAYQSYFADFAEAHDLEDTEDLIAAVGEETLGTLDPCVLEFFFSNDYRKDGARWNVIDLFLKKRGELLNNKEKTYLRALRQSHMSLYEVMEIKPDSGLVLRDMIEGGIFHVQDKSLSSRCVQWDVVAVRICGKVLGGAGMIFDRQAATVLAKDIAALHAMGMGMLAAGAASGDYSLPEHERLLKVMWAKEIGTGYLEQCLKERNRKIELRNRDNHKLQFHTLTFPLNASWKDIAAKLDTVDDYHKDEDTAKRKFWNWVRPCDTHEILVTEDGDDDVQVRYFETTLQGGDLSNPVHVLGTIELRKDRLVAQANSFERSEILEKRLETLLAEQIGEAVWQKDGEDSDENEDGQGDGQKFTPEEITEGLHAALTEHYREWMTMQVPDLGNKTPKEMSKTAAGRKKLVETLKSLEISVRKIERDNGVLRPLALDWLWDELKVDRKTA